MFSAQNVTIFLLSMATTVAFFVPPVQAQSSQKSSIQSAGTLGVARMIQMKNKNIPDGTIVSVTKDGAVPSSNPYDSQVQGVVARDAGIILNNTNYEDGTPVISVGTVYVLVSSINGTIKRGDMIATSTMPGVGMKATKDGYVLGSALEDYTTTDPKKADIIAVEFNLHYFNAKTQFPGTLTDILKIAILPTKDGPSPIMKYIIAALVCISSFVLAYMTFGRTAAKGVEALGRNPAASRIIHLGIIFNVGIVVVIVLSGLTIAFFILRL